MIGKILGKVVGLPIRAAGLAVRAVEEVVMALPDACEEQRSPRPVSRAIRRLAKDTEGVIEEGLDA